MGPDLLTDPFDSVSVVRPDGSRPPLQGRTFHTFTVDPRHTGVVRELFLTESKE